jgi:hypothetical protein
MSPSDPRFVSTLNAILASVAEDGLVSNNLVFRYDVEKTGDGCVGEEGTFSMCTFWAVEAAARLGAYDRSYLEKARMMFEQMLGYANHLGLFAEEIGKRGEHLGNFPQGSQLLRQRRVQCARKPTHCTDMTSSCLSVRVFICMAGFTHLALISAAINLDRGLDQKCTPG